jgi:hypothetical protein
MGDGMGCDIHFYVEVRTENGWTLAPGQLEACERCDGSTLDPEHKHCGNCNKGIDHHEEGTNKCLFEASELREVPDPCSYDCLKGQDLKKTYYRGRDYDLFGILSEVRGPGVPGFTKGSCGMPPDLSPEIHYFSQSPDWHSHTWYSLSELEKHKWGAEQQYFKKTLKKMAELGNNHDDIRAVFWYDN